MLREDQTVGISVEGDYLWYMSRIRCEEPRVVELHTPRVEKDGFSLTVTGELEIGGQRLVVESCELSFDQIVMNEGDLRIDAQLYSKV